MPDLTPKQAALLRSLANANEPVEDLTVRFARMPRAYFRNTGSAGSRGRAFFAITEAGRQALAAAEAV